MIKMYGEAAGPKFCKQLVNKKEECFIMERRHRKEIIFDFYAEARYTVYVISL